MDTIRLLFPADQKLLPLRLITATLSCLCSLVALLSVGGDIVIITLPQGGAESVLYVLGAFAFCRLLNKKVIFDYRDEWEDYLIDGANSDLRKSLLRLLKKVMRTLYSRSEGVVAVTPAVRQILERSGVDRVYLIPSGVDTKLFRPLEDGARRGARVRVGLPVEGFVVLYSAGKNVAPYYSPRTVVEAFSIFATNQDVGKAVLVLLGSSEEMGKICSLARKFLSLTDNIRYLGKKSDLEMAEITASCDVAVIPFTDRPIHRNVYPMRFFEYLACGLPIVCSAHEDSLLARTIRGNQVGSVVPPLDVARLTEALRSFYFNRGFQQEAGSHARALAENEFDKDELARRYLSLLETV